jgi:hypothetical protein
MHSASSESARHGVVMSVDGSGKSTLAKARPRARKAQKKTAPVGAVELETCTCEVNPRIAQGAIQCFKSHIPFSSKLAMVV